MSQCQTGNCGGQSCACYATGDAAEGKRGGSMKLKLTWRRGRRRTRHGRHGERFGRDAVRLKQIAEGRRFNRRRLRLCDGQSRLSRLFHRWRRLRRLAQRQRRCLCARHVGAGRVGAEYLV